VFFGEVDVLERIEEEVRRKFEEAEAHAKRRAEAEEARRKAEEQSKKTYEDFANAFRGTFGGDWANAFFGGRARPTVKQDVVQVDIDISRLRKLLMLCHPDRHGNSESSTEMTRWLIEIRKKLIQ